MTQIDDATARTLHESERKSLIRIVLVEDHRILREGVKALLELESDVVIVGEYGCVRSSLGGINELQPDLIVVDLALPNGSGIDLLGSVTMYATANGLTANDAPEVQTATQSPALA